MCVDVGCTANGILNLRRFVNGKMKLPGGSYTRLLHTDCTVSEALSVLQKKQCTLLKRRLPDWKVDLYERQAVSRNGS